MRDDCMASAIPWHKPKFFAGGANGTFFGIALQI